MRQDNFLGGDIFSEFFEVKCGANEGSIFLIDMRL